jgi:hypothetical protein
MDSKQWRTKKEILMRTKKHNKADRPLELKSGKRYRTRSGQETTPLTTQVNLFHPFAGHLVNEPAIRNKRRLYQWAPDGTVNSHCGDTYCGADLNLVEELK